MELPRNSSVHSVDKAMALIELLLERRAPMTLSQLAERSGCPKSTVHALLSTLRAHRMVDQREDGRYCLGLRLFECGCAVSASWDISLAARPCLEQLSAAAEASVFLAVADGQSALTVDRCAGPAAVQVVPEAGSRLPLHATSQGKLLLSQLSESEVRRRMKEAGMTAFTPHTITDVELLLPALAQIRQAGYAVEDGEYRIGLRAVSAPVYDREGRGGYAVGAVGLFRRVRSEEFEALTAQVLRAAEQLSRAVGYRG